VWAVDFQFDATTDERPIKLVSIIDEHTRECLTNLVDRSVTADALIDELDPPRAAAWLPGGAAVRQRPRTRLRRDGRLGRRTGRTQLHPARGAVALLTVVDLADDAVIGVAEHWDATRPRSG
jgi:hypothetical protein